MDAAIKAQWIKDLTSGEFKQGENALERNGKFCCLGVLCYRAAEAGVIQRIPSAVTTTFWYGETQSLLPPEVVKWAGLPSDRDDPDVTRGHYVNEAGEDRYLTVDNDGHGHDFTRIAETVRVYF